jgi:hypothetical protein
MMSSCTPAAEREEEGVTSDGYLHPYSRERGKEAMCKWNGR